MYCTQFTCPKVMPALSRFWTVQEETNARSFTRAGERCARRTDFAKSNADFPPSTSKKRKLHEHAAHKRSRVKLIEKVFSILIDCRSNAHPISLTLPSSKQSYRRTRKLKKSMAPTYGVLWAAGGKIVIYNPSNVPLARVFVASSLPIKYCTLSTVFRCS